MQIFTYERYCDSKVRTVNIVDGCGEETEEDDPPSYVGHALPGRLFHFTQSGNSPFFLFTCAARLLKYVGHNLPPLASCSLFTSRDLH